MPPRHTDHTLTSTLHALDPADRAASGLTRRARLDFDRIVATPRNPTPAPGDRPIGTPRRRRAARRVLVGGALTAAVATAGVLSPAVLGGDTAFASWTPTASTDLTPGDRAQAASQCADVQGDGAGRSYASRLRTARTPIVEARGDWTAVYFADPDGFTALCITDESTRLFRDWIGSIGIATDLPAPAPDQLVATDLGSGTMHAGDVSLAAGRAGADVTAVTYPSGAHGRVSATVTDGAFLLWLPGDELRTAETAGVDVEVTLRDGTTDTARLAL